MCGGGVPLCVYQSAGQGGALGLIREGYLGLYI